jgi:hypothetical protein
MAGHESQKIKKNPNHDSRKLKFAIFENFTNNGESIRDINVKKMCTFEVPLRMMSGQLILSGKPFNTFSMTRLKILQLRLTLTPLSNTTMDPGSRE